MLLLSQIILCIFLISLITDYSNRLQFFLLFDISPYEFFITYNISLCNIFA